jgi:hypothetical protein
VEVIVRRTQGLAKLLSLINVIHYLSWVMRIYIRHENIEKSYLKKKIVLKVHDRKQLTGNHMKAEQTKEIDTKQNSTSAALTRELRISRVLSLISSCH